MVRVKITPRKRKKRVRFLDEVQADSSRPRASYTPTPTSDADVLKFIQKKAAEQRQTQPWWEKLASPTKQQWAYANAYHRAEEYAKKRGALRSPTKKKQQRRRAGRHPPMRKKKPPKPKTCMTLMELARAFPNIAQQVCFHPKQSTFNSVVGRVPRSKQKVAQWL